MLISRVRKEVSHSDWLFVCKLKERPLENLSGGRGGRAKYKKNIRARENCMKKILARQLIIKIFMLWPKKNSFKDFDKEKKFLRFENSPPPP